MIAIGKELHFGMQQFYRALFKGEALILDETSCRRLEKCRRFIDYLLQKEISVYGLTTGFADLRERPVKAEEAAALSHNILQSHDAGIGPDLSSEVTLGAMIVRANSLSKGYSGFQKESLNTLIAMINEKIIPAIPATGSLGASGDLAFLARLGRAMQGHDLPVHVKGERLSAKEALARAGIAPFYPKAKEGLALTNGTAFMASMMAIAYFKELHLLENMLAGIILFLNAAGAIDAPFYKGIQDARGQSEQSLMAKLLLDSLKGSPFIDRSGVQNDYCIRCLPQIFGPRFGAIFSHYRTIERELDAVTDNPLIFRGEEISPDINPARIIQFEGEPWAVLSGGNFHGENTTTAADSILMNNAKIALTMERQLTYLLNPFRNKNSLPHYLIPDEKRAGLHSGYMIPQYSANAIAQKMAQLALPSSLFNITSANESEDVVSYGATAAKTLLEQLALFEQLTLIYMTIAAQAYAIKREISQKRAPDDSPAEKIFAIVNSNGCFPTREDRDFVEIYRKMGALLQTTALRSELQFPLSLWGSGIDPKEMGLLLS